MMALRAWWHIVVAALVVVACAPAATSTSSRHGVRDARRTPAEAARQLVQDWEDARRVKRRVKHALPQDTGVPSGPSGKRIVKLGTVDFDMVETTPVLFRGELWRFESVRGGYWNNMYNHEVSYFRFRSIDNGTVTPPFGFELSFGSALVVNVTADDGSEDAVETIFVLGTRKGVPSVTDPNVTHDHIQVMWTTDMQLYSSAVALEFPVNYTVFNTDLHFSGGGYNNGSFVMSIELGAPQSIVGHPFTIFFATTDHATPASGWKLLDPTRYKFTTTRYSACPCVRWVPETGTYYIMYLNSTADGWKEHAARSTNLQNWTYTTEAFMVADGYDRDINPVNSLPAAIAANIMNCTDDNNSDFDMVQVTANFTYITYSWGDQHEHNWLGAALYPGTERMFLEGLFADLTKVAAL